MSMTTNELPYMPNEYMIDLGEGDEERKGEELAIANTVDDDGHPFGGTVYGRGIRIDWQAGPTRSDDSPIPPNGAFVEDAILAAKARLLFFQEGRFACKENAKAMYHLVKALMALKKRTKDRRKRGVLGRNEE